MNDFYRSFFSALLFVQAGWMIDFSRMHGIVYLPFIDTTYILSGQIWYLFAICLWSIALLLSRMPYLMIFVAAQSYNFIYNDMTMTYGYIWNDLFYTNLLIFVSVWLYRYEKKLFSAQGL